jgi:hypothetical protein
MIAPRKEQLTQLHGTEGMERIYGPNWKTREDI